jgi:sporulation protein YlmC with PRC-barrel domain
MVEITRLVEMKGRDVYGSDGDKIGSVDEIYVDDQTSQPEWFSLGTGIFGTRTRLVPVESATFTDDGVRVPFTKDRVKEAPDVDIDEGYLDEGAETQLYEYYGLRRGGMSSTSGMPAGQQEMRRPGTSGTSGMSRSEREMRRGRLRRWSD